MRARVVIEIKYDSASIEASSDKSIERALNWAVNHLASEGMLDDGAAIVEEWSHSVSVSDYRSAEKEQPT